MAGIFKMAAKSLRDQLGKLQHGFYVLNTIYMASKPFAKIMSRMCFLYI